MSEKRRPYKSYPEAFKLEALHLLESSGRPASEIARELGIRRNQLYKWKEQMSQKGKVASASGSGLNNAMPDGNFLYFYHPDHLGSTAYVTDGNAKLFEHMEYFPFGETWVDQHSNTQRVPYLFTGKEYDETTGLYYFGARYYDPRTSVWESADPALARYLDNGIYRPDNLALFTYAYNNPIRFGDPTGESVADFILGIGNAIDNNMTMGMTPRLQGNADLTRGQFVGDLVSMLVGDGEATAGAGGDVVGGGLDLTGAGAVAGVPLNVVSTAAIAHGVVVQGHAIGEIAHDLSLMHNENKGSGGAKGATQARSKVRKEVREETLGGGRFTKKTKVIPGKGPGQSRSEMEFVKNKEGKLIRSRKFSYDRGNKLQHTKPARGGPEGRPANED